MFFSKKSNNSTLTVDIHSHLLHDLDDGCENCAESVSLLRLSRAQGIEIMVATPHFYPSHQSPEDFIAKRDRSVEALKKAVEESGITDIPKVAVGAEVAYFNGISRCECLDMLCIRGTRVLLVEMPQREWSSMVLDELISLCSMGITPVIAHIERCIGFQRADVKRALLESDILIQSNAEAFLSLRDRGASIRSLRSGYIDLLGSDAHNMSHRTQNIADAAALISARLGDGAVSELDATARRLLRGFEAVI